MNRRSEELALKKELIRLRLNSHRLEIAADMATLRNPLRNAAISGSVLRLLRSHPILVTGTSALLTRVPRLGLLIKLAGAALAAWQVAQFIRALRR
jgi:hypothetical protein